ncbi:DUF4132 domain-containing protein [Buchananella hordeovulneris]|uniref:DUF4132 domain-containing protein n=1 Tax=Buchananella hordeovulneris TaxID=52770 RepID=UPI000F5D918F|nr:DUF4132 domain-containing protein [Buchananella hordeovulneris]RRD52074.1 DUF4132 domain-containing protein [Buchananella hordeovulneris]
MPKKPASTTTQPLTVDTAAPDDLGLRLTVFEELYAPGATQPLPLDETPFDPDAEAERAARIARVDTYKASYRVEGFWRFTEPLFTGIPRPERAAWWREYFKQHAPKGMPNWIGPLEILPAWLETVLLLDSRRPLPELLEALHSLQKQHSHYHVVCQIPAALHLWSEAEVAAARAALPSPLPPLIVPTQRGNYIHDMLDASPHLQAASLAALSEADMAAMSGSATGCLTSWSYTDTVLLSLVFPTVEQRVAFARRTGANISSWRAAVPWLVGTGTAGFPLLLETVNSLGKEHALVVVQMLAEAGHGPAMTELFLDLLSTKAGPAADQWLRAHLPQALAARLTPARAAALAPFLREVPIAELRAVAEQTSGATRAVVDEILAEADLPELPAASDWWAAARGRAELPPASKLPFAPSVLPPVVLTTIDGSVRLSQEQVGELLRALAAPERHPLVEAVAERATPASRDRFAIGVVAAWLTGGAPNNRAWLLTGSGWLGSDGFVHYLTPLVREWPGVAQHQRAVKGLTALANVASELALSQISGIAAKVKFAAIKKRAGEAMEEIAAARGLSRDELEDRILPTGGLDARGQRHFDYGARRFVAYLTPEAKLVFRLLDEQERPTGKVLTSLPKPNKSDDADRAAAARDEAKVLKKTVTTLAKLQVERFERALVTQRRWAAADFTNYIAAHPLLAGLLAGLIWAVWDGDTLRATGRLEEGQLVDRDDEPLQLGDLHVTLAHPLDLDEATRAGWAEVLADYELTTPFKQLDRPVYALPTGQGDDFFLQGLPTAPIAAAKLVGAATKRGWQRGAALDAGVYCLFGLPLPTCNVTAVLLFEDGMWMGSPSDNEDQKLSQLYLRRGLDDPGSLGWGDPDKDRADNLLVPWHELPPALASEIIALVEQLRG